MKHIHLSLKQVTRMVYASSVLFLLVGILFSAVLTPVEAKRIDEPGSWTSGSGNVTAAAPAAYDTPVGPLDHEAIQLELEAICGYVEEQQTGRFYWVVRNDSALSGEVAWQVVGSTESGGFTIGAYETLTFTTTAGAAKTVQLLVHGVVVAEASSLPACKKYLQLTYVCTPDNNLQWAVVNDNLYLDATFTWSLDGSSPVDGGYLGPNQTRNLIVTNNLVEHTITLTWYHWPMGLRTISLTAPAQSCIENTATPTVTSTPTATLTVTPTETATLTVTPTETATPTDTPAPTETLTPTATDTPAPTETATPTEMSTPTDTPVPTETSTPTLVIPPTDTPVPTPTLTATVESTPTDTPVPTATNTSEVPPTDTPVPTATEVVEFTATSTEVTSGGTPTLPVDPTPTLQETQSITNTPGSPATLPPPQPTRNVLIPVTGADLTVQNVSVANPSAFFINLGLVFAGLGLVLTGISKRPRRK